MTTATHKLTWTSERPTQEGWYWVNLALHRSKIVYVSKQRAYGGRFCVVLENGSMPIDEIPAFPRWAGPIPLPEEPV